MNPRGAGLARQSGRLRPFFRLGLARVFLFRNHAPEIEMNRGADAFGAFDAGKAAEPPRQGIGLDHRRTRRCVGIEDRVETGVGEAGAVILEGQPDIVAGGAARRLRGGRVVDRLIAGPDDQRAAARHPGRRLGGERADRRADRPGVGLAQPRLGRQ